VRYDDRESVSQLPPPPLFSQFSMYETIEEYHTSTMRLPTHSLGIITLLSHCLALLVPQQAPDQLSLGQPETVVGICPSFKVNCVLDDDWRRPIGSIGKKRVYLPTAGKSTMSSADGRQAFCRVGLRCNQCEENVNSRECNVLFRKECGRMCKAYGPIPF
jgi:hypothetical protein